MDESERVTKALETWLEWFRDYPAGGLVAAVRLVLAEYNRARNSHEPFHSAHEGFAVLKEEVDELWHEVTRKDRDPRAMLREAVQVGAMALRFVAEVCGEALEAEGRG